MESDSSVANSAQRNSDVLVVVDQHAAHERVRLEQLTSSKSNIDLGHNCKRLRTQVLRLS